VPAAAPEKIHVLHIITGLDVGGAEVMLCRMMEHYDKRRFTHEVICLREPGKLAARVEASGAALHCLNMNRWWRIPSGIGKMAKVIREYRPDLVQTWLAHATLIGSLVSRFTTKAPVVWSIHTGQQDPSRIKLSVRLINHCLAKLSGVLPTKIVSCSRVALERHVELGYARSKMQLIPNGTDTDYFVPQDEEALQLRKKLGIPEDAPVVGIAGRWTPEKDYPNFFRAAVKLQSRMPKAHFVVCGAGLETSNPLALELFKHAPKPGQFHLLGIRQDMPVVYSAMDLATLTSASEAFPLTLGEAMACGVPCVATDVGDCRTILGDTGTIVRPMDCEQLAAAWEEMLRMSPEDAISRSHQARQRVVQLFSMSRYCTSHAELYESLVVKKTFTRRVVVSSTPQQIPAPFLFRKWRNLFKSM